MVNVWRLVFEKTLYGKGGSPAKKKQCVPKDRSEMHAVRELRGE